MVATFEYDTSKASDREVNSLRVDSFNTHGIDLLQPKSSIFAKGSKDSSNIGTIYHKTVRDSSSEVKIKKKKLNVKRAKDENLDILERQFDSNPNHTSQERSQVTKFVNISEKNVTI